MEFYWVLVVSTTIIAGLAALLFVRTGSVSFPLGMLFLYFWSLHGGWSIVADGLGAAEKKPHHYLYEKIFSIELNDDYLHALLLYAGFVIVIELTVLWTVRKPPVGSGASGTPVHISHASVLLVSVIAALASYLIVKDQLMTAVMLGKSGYAATRGGLGELLPLFTLHQVLNRVALFPLAIGVAVLIVGRNGKWIVGDRNVLIGIGYAAVLGCLFVYLTILGNKNELFSGLILGGLLYVANSKTIRWGMVGSAAAAAIVGIVLVDFLRAFPLIALWEEMDWWEALEWVSEVRGSNEAFGAHFSLYGALHFHAPFTYGSSFVSLLASAVPRLVWPDRPGDIYAHYTANTGIVEGIGEQGFSIHHATGWYLNFGLLGLFLGALIWGLIWARCFNAYQGLQGENGTPRWWYMFALLAPWGFVASIPPLIRAGPEGYKGLVIEGLLIPAIVLTVASYGQGPFRRLVSPPLPAAGRPL